MKLKMLFTVAITLILSACVSGPKYTPMTQEAKNSTQKVELYNLVIQDEIRPSPDLSNATGALGGGLLVAMIDSSINKGRSLTAQDIVEPLYNATEDFDYRVMISQAMNQSLSKEFTLNEQKETAEAILLSNEQLQHRIDNLNEGEALLLLSSFYRFLDNSQVLTTETLAFFYLNPEKGSPLKKATSKKPTYFNSVSYQSKKVGSGASNSIESWSKNDGALFKEYLKAGLIESAEMLAYDMQPILEENCLKQGKINIATAIGYKNVEGKLIKQVDNRSTVRANSGYIVSSEAGFLEIKPKKKNEQCS